MDVYTLRGNALQSGVALRDDGVNVNTRSVPEFPTANGLRQDAQDTFVAQDLMSPRTPFQALAFRKAAPGEATEGERILRVAFAPYVQKLGRALDDASYLWLADAFVAGSVYVGSLKDKIVCAAATEAAGQTLYIAQIGVDPEWQGSGLGVWLLAGIEEAARAAGFQALSLDTAVMMDALLRFYARAGFRETGRGPPKHQRDSHMRVYLSKPL